MFDLMKYIIIEGDYYFEPVIPAFVMIFNSKPAFNEINSLDCMNLCHLLLRFFIPLKNCGLKLCSFANFIVS